MAIAPTGAIYKSLSFDGENSRNYGVYITGEAVYNAPERDVEMITIPGRNGSFALDNGRFQNIEVSYPAGIFADTEADFRQAISDFRNFLCSRKGYVRLQDEYNPDEYRMAVYKSGLEVDPAMLRAGEFKITFDCKPQRWLTSGEELVEVGEYAEPVGTDNAPYLFRSSPQFSDGYDTEMDSLVGGTVAWNQLAENISSFSPQKATISVVDNVATLTATSEAVSSGYVGISISGSSVPNPMSNHKYLLSAEVKKSVSGNITYQYGSNLTITIFDAPTDTWINISGISTNANPSGQYLQLRAYGTWTVGATANVKNVMLIDLTQMFGSTIADYIYTLEQNNAGAGVAWFKRLFAEDYYPYDSGSLISVKTSAHVMRDADNNIIGNYPLDADLELRGIPKLDASNKLYYDGDTYEADGTVTRKYGIVDLGSLTWNRGSNDIMFANFVGLKYVSDNVIVNAVCPKYIAVTKNAFGAGAIDKAFRSDNSATILYFKDSAYTDSATFKSAMSGVYLVYELATPTTETADAFESIQTVSPLGTEEYTDTRTVPIPVGHDTKYGMNPNVIINPTLFDASPLLEIEGTGDINFNGFTVSIETSDIGNVTIPYTQSGGTFTLDLSQLNTGDVITVSGIKVSSNRSYNNYATVHLFHIKTSSHIPSGWSYDLGKGALTVGVYVNLPDITLSKGTAYTSDTAVIDCSAHGTKKSDGTTITWTTSDSITFAYDGTDTLTITHSRNDSLTPTAKSVTRTIESITGYSTIPYDFGVIFCDTDIGEFYRIEDGQIISMNHVGDLGSKLPTLASGANEITYDNTITDLKIAPRYWKV